jgi:DNA alkylation repair enzyme
MAGDIDRRFHRSRDPARAVAEKRYLKSDLAFLGTGVPAVRAIVKATRRTYPALDHGTLLELVQLLWRRCHPPAASGLASPCAAGRIRITIALSPWRLRGS